MQIYPGNSLKSETIVSDLSEFPGYICITNMNIKNYLMNDVNYATMKKLLDD